MQAIPVPTRTLIPGIHRDAVTPNQDFIISPHPESRNLYIAGGGSFHNWKFPANIGKYVTQMLTGELEHGLAKKWAWNRTGRRDCVRDLRPIEVFA